MASELMLTVEVCHIGVNDRFLRTVQVPVGCTVGDALRASGVYDVLTALTEETIKVGIFSKLKPLDAVLRDHDRIEIYRPLVVDPMTARRARATKKR